MIGKLLLGNRNGKRLAFGYVAPNSYIRCSFDTEDTTKTIIENDIEIPVFSIGDKGSIDIEGIDTPLALVRLESITSEAGEYLSCYMLTYWVLDDAIEIEVPLSKLKTNPPIITQEDVTQHAILDPSKVKISMIMSVTAPIAGGW